MYLRLALPTTGTGQVLASSVEAMGFEMADTFLFEALASVVSLHADRRFRQVARPLPPKT